MVTATKLPGLEADANSTGAAGSLSQPVDKEALIGRLEQGLR